MAIINIWGFNNSTIIPKMDRPLTTCKQDRYKNRIIYETPDEKGTTNKEQLQKREWKILRPIGTLSMSITGRTVHELAWFSWMYCTNALDAGCWVNSSGAGCCFVNQFFMHFSSFDRQFHQYKAKDFSTGHWVGCTRMPVAVHAYLRSTYDGRFNACS